ncbi:DUF4236 domain-containing protein [Mesorhizobium sp. M0578]|uniref:DUF4236 domain-containing protein n=1 Tax=unclassified Mesorhizobium TaxID=325217 RepID=UPI00333A9276
MVEGFHYIVGDKGHRGSNRLDSLSPHHVHGGAWGIVFRFRKSVRIAPGVRINLNAKSASVRVGPKGLGYTVSTTGKKRLSASIPGPFPRIPEAL